MKISPHSNFCPDYDDWFNPQNILKSPKYVKAPDWKLEWVGEKSEEDDFLRLWNFKVFHMQFNRYLFTDKLTQRIF